jgi:hypothetical protein
MNHPDFLFYFHRELLAAREAMSTFVDDVSAFLIDMPLMHRSSTAWLKHVLLAGQRELAKIQRSS